MASSLEPQVVGVIGSPITHSLSPLLHNTAFEEMGMPWTSVAFEVGVGGGAGAVESMRLLGIRGLSVTMPLKAEVALAADLLEQSAKMLNSVNCLSLEGGTIVGLSTDGDGLLAAIAAHNGLSVADRSVMVVGSGGAARSVAAALGLAGASEVIVVARNRSNASLVAALSGTVGRVGDSGEASGVDLIIETTPVGMEGTAERDSTPLVPGHLLHAGQVAVDLVYRPRETDWILDARRSGADAIGGLGMLVHQAALQIERWTGADAPVNKMRDAVSGELGGSSW
ncbi:MAG: shikimate dehydrogenase [Actinomycetes bacterium]